MFVEIDEAWRNCVVWVWAGKTWKRHHQWVGIVGFVVAAVVAVAAVAVAAVVTSIIVVVMWGFVFVCVVNELNHDGRAFLVDRKKMRVKSNTEFSVTNSPGAIDAGAVFCNMGLYLVCCFDCDRDERRIVVVEQCCVVIVNDEFAISWCVVQHNQCTVVTGIGSIIADLYSVAVLS